MSRDGTLGTLIGKNHVSTETSPHPPDYQRLRIRFRKEGDLRWISHRDLVRVIERLCRRSGLVLRMSEGFHPKPKLRFPSALALGIEGQGEVLELDLVVPVEPAQLAPRLNQLAPPGLVVTHVDVLTAGQRKARACSMHYQFPVPPARREQVAEVIASLLAAPAYPIERAGRSEPIDLLANLADLHLDGDRVCFALRAVTAPGLSHVTSCRRWGWPISNSKVVS